MVGILKVFTKRPSDKNIRIYKVLFGVLLSTSTFYNLIIQGDPLVESLFQQMLTQSTTEYIKYAIVSLGFFPILSGITDIHLMKAKYNRYLQIFTAILLFYVAGIIKDSAQLEVDTLVGLLGFVALIAGVTGKFISQKGLKHGEKITKIRV